jgi:taurine--2-oxoglutarate transaminase
MKSNDTIRLCKQHTFYPWFPQGFVNPLAVDRASGIYFWDAEGKRYIDFNSQFVCVNIGHNHPRVVEAVKQQADKLFFACHFTATEPRARLGRMLAEIVGSDIRKFFFTNGGADANEAAIRITRLYTGRHKILSRYRSYHGSSLGAAMLTGDASRWPNEPGAPGFIKVLDPVPYGYSFGTTEQDQTANCLRYLAEVIDYENPQTIAAMFIEPMVGTNGFLPPPAGYLEGLRELLDRHGILLVCDEVMTGFGRTGKMFAYQHAGIRPDIICMAKGLTSAALPLGAMGVSESIARHFDVHPFAAGLTYSAHPMAVAAAVAAVGALVDEQLVENAARLEPVMLAHMEKLRAEHRCVAAGRAKGLFGAIEFQRNGRGAPLSEGYNVTHPVVGKLLWKLREKGLFTLARGNILGCNPPLCITEAQLAEAFEILHECLPVVDALCED